MIISNIGIKKKLSNKELMEAAAVFADAFSSHKNIKRIFSKKRSLYYLFLTFLKVINNTGDILIHYIDEEPIGYLTFMEPKNGKDITLPRMLRYGFGSLLMFLSVTIKDLRKVFAYIGDYSDKNEIKGKNIHLMQAAIKPMFKGQGLMSILFKQATEVFEEYDAIVLETSDPNNVGLYKHLGYEVVQKIDELYIFRKDLSA